MLCPNCQKELPSEARFCDGCGYAVSAPAPEPAYSEPIPAPAYSESVPAPAYSEQAPAYSEPAPTSTYSEQAPAYSEQVPAGPEGFALDGTTGKYYRHDTASDGAQWITWYDPATGQYEQAPCAQADNVYAAQGAAPAAPAAPQRGGNKGLLLALCIAVPLVIGGGVAGFIFRDDIAGLFTKDTPASPSESDRLTPPPSEDPSPSNDPSPSSDPSPSEQPSDQPPARPELIDWMLAGSVNVEFDILGEATDDDGTVYVMRGSGKLIVLEPDMYMQLVVDEVDGVRIDPLIFCQIAKGDKEYELDAATMLAYESKRALDPDGGQIVLSDSGIGVVAGKTLPYEEYTNQSEGTGFRFYIDGADVYALTIHGGTAPPNFVMLVTSATNVIPADAFDVPPGYTIVSDSAADGVGNTSGNIANWGYAALHDGKIYYANGAQWNALYVINTDGSGKMRLNEHYSMYINVVGDTVYYVNGDDGDKIYSVKTDGTGARALNGDYSSSVVVVNGVIYYINDSNGGAIYAMNLDGSGGRVVVADEVDSFAVYDGKIYYDNWNDSMRIYVANLDGSNAYALNSNVSDCINIVDGVIYYINWSDNNKVYRMNLDGSDDRAVSDDEVRSVNVHNGKVYFADEGNGGNLYSMNLDGSGKRELTDHAVTCVNVAGTRIYYIHYDEWTLYTVSADGGESRPVS